MSARRDRPASRRENSLRLPPTGRRTPNRSILFVGSVAAGALMAACDGNPVAAPDADLPSPRFEIIAGNGQTGLVGQELPDPLVVRALDGRGHPMRRELVNFVATRGGGSVWAGATLTDRHGYARDYWTLGLSTEPDGNEVEVRAVDPSTGEKHVFARFVATGIPVPPPETPEVDLVFVVDGSGSMEGERTAFSNSITTFYAEIATAADVRLVLIASSTFCLPGPIGSGSCPGDELPPDYIHVAADIGSTDALSHVLSTYPSWGPVLRAGSSKMFVVLADGDPQISAASFDQDLKSLDPSLEGYVFSACAPPPATGEQYMILVNTTGGVFADECEGSMGPFLTSVGGAL